LYVQINSAGWGCCEKYIVTINGNKTAAHRPSPIWDADLRELRVGELVIKRFRQPARNQVIVLASFHELRWPRRIDDPLTGNSDVEPKRRLRDTVFALNRNHVTANVLAFEADGTGTGVIWKWCC
jgi:hypothetical protein